MKSLKRVLTVSAFVLATLSLSAQSPPPNDGGTGTSQSPSSGGNTPVGGGAPIGGGLFILIGLGAAYGGKKVFNHYQDSKENLEA